MSDPKRGERLQSKVTGQYYDVLKVKGSSFKVHNPSTNSTFWRPLKGWEEILVRLVPGDARVESLFYSAKIDRFQIVGVDSEGKFYRASSVGQWKVDNHSDAAAGMAMNDYKLVGRL